MSRTKPERLTLERLRMMVHLFDCGLAEPSANDYVESALRELLDLREAAEGQSATRVGRACAEALEAQADAAWLAANTIAWNVAEDHPHVQALRAMRSHPALADARKMGWIK